MPDVRFARCEEEVKRHKSRLCKKGKVETNSREKYFPFWKTARQYKEDRRKLVANFLLMSFPGLLLFCYYKHKNRKKANNLLMSLSDLSSYISSFSLHFHVGSISVQIKTYFVHLGCLKTYTIVSFWEIELKRRDCMTVVTLMATITFLFINICICDYFDDMIFVRIVYIFESDIRMIYRVFL